MLNSRGARLVSGSQRSRREKDAFSQLAQYAKEKEKKRTPCKYRSVYECADFFCGHTIHDTLAGSDRGSARAREIEASGPWIPREAEGSPLFKLIGMEKKKKTEGRPTRYWLRRRGWISEPPRPDRAEITSARLDTFYRLLVTLPRR